MSTFCRICFFVDGMHLIWYIEVNPELYELYYDLVGDVTMDTILDMTKFFLSSVFFFYLQHMLHVTIYCFCSCRVIALAYRFGKMVPVTAIMDAISL